MQLTYLRTALPHADSLSKITALSWSANSQKLAAVSTDRVVHVFDEHGARKDKFKTKPADPSSTQTYIVRCMAFSPDSTKLAIAQSDDIVFIYRLGSDWGEKKSICNKFQQSSSVTSMTWPCGRDNELVFGLADGKVKCGVLKTNKPLTLYDHPNNSYVTCMTARQDGSAVIAGHADGSLHRFQFDSETGPAGSAKFAQHSCAPAALAWGSDAVLVTGSDCKVTLYDFQGGALQQLDFSAAPDAHDFTCAAFSPSGDVALLGGYNSISSCSFNAQAGAWELAETKQIENLYCVTALEWKPDGSCLAVGNLSGGVDLFEACLRRHRYKGAFEFTYVSKSQVLVKRLSSGAQIMLKSRHQYEVERINIHQDRFLVAHTAQTLLLGDLQTCQLSEVSWETSGNKKYHFDNAQVCLVYDAGELSLIEYGQNTILGSARTEHMSPYLISVCINPSRGNLAAEKKMAYLVDKQTAKVVDLIIGVLLATVSHNAKIDWLELNARATHLLFRDKRRQLHLYNIGNQERVTLLPYCSYVQWVPGSDVVVAQSRNTLCVWYSINAPDQQTTINMNGEVEDIQRSRGKTEVLVQEASNTVSYVLDENLIDFGSALEARDYDRAVDTLEPLEMTPETESQWHQLAKAALEDGRLPIAERCYAAVGNVARAHYLHQVQELAPAEELGSHSMVQAKLAQLGKQWGVAEGVLLAQGQVEEAIQMYTQANKWDDAIGVAVRGKASEAEALKRQRYQWLLETGQEEEAGRVKEKDGDFVGAMNLFMQGGLPARAAQVVLTHPNRCSSSLLESITTACLEAGLLEKAGSLYEQQQRWADARTVYRQGHVYHKALVLARRNFPAQVVPLEEEWGDWLMSQHQVDAAINHFIEAGCSMKAVEAALAARQWNKAAAILDSQDPQTAAPFYQRLALHFEQAQSLEEAERYYIKAGLARKAVDMYAAAGKWSAAHKVATGFLPEIEVHDLYMQKANDLEAEGKLREAEKMLCTIKEYDAAIKMYRQRNMYDHVIRLVAQHRKGQLAETHVEVAQEQQAEGALKEAEGHYVEGGDWKGAVQMYRLAGMWDSSLRLAKAHGGPLATKQVAFAWAASIEPEEGAQLLIKLGLLDPAIDFALESGAFAQAFQLCQVAAAQHKMPDCHLKYAMYLEDEGRFSEAEEEFLRAEKPREAIDMYCHQQDWAAALRVAEGSELSSIPKICLLQGEAVAQAGNCSEAEGLFLRAKQPDLALQMYRAALMWDDALRIAEDYLPAKVPEVHADMQSQTGSSKQTLESQVARARTLERAGQWSGAIDAYLAITTQDTADLDFLEGVWESAVNLAMSNRKERIGEVVGTVAQRLMQNKRYEAAAELLQGIDDIQGAVQAHIMGNQFDKAQALARTDPALQQYVEEQHTKQLLQSRNAEGLASSGNAAEAIEVYAQQGEWEKVHQLAGAAGPQAVAKYTLRHAKQKAQQGEVAEAAAVLAEHGAPPDIANLDLYKHIVSAVLSLSRDEQSKQGNLSCKDFLWQLIQPVQATLTGANAIGKEVYQWWQAVHYCSLKQRCSEAGLHELAAKQATSLLRYIGIIPADKAFYEAGCANLEAGKLNMAFVFLNRYLDLTEAMDDADAGPLENADFVDTDIPFDFHIPSKHYVPEAMRQQVQDKVLSLSLDQTVSQELSRTSCSHCGASMYEAALVCQSCHQTFEACCVSGCPIAPAEQVVGTDCPLPASRHDWNIYVNGFQTCPITGSAQTPVL